MKKLMNKGMGAEGNTLENDKKDDNDDVSQKNKIICQK